MRLIGPTEIPRATHLCVVACPMSKRFVQPSGKLGNLNETNVTYAVLEESPAEV